MEKKQDVKAKKPEYWDTVYYIDYIGRIRKRTWINDEDNVELDYDVWTGGKAQGTVVFTSKQLVFDAIEAIGKDRILKYLFDVDCEEETND